MEIPPYNMLESLFKHGGLGLYPRKIIPKKLVSLTAF